MNHYNELAVLIGQCTIGAAVGACIGIQIRSYLKQRALARKVKANKEFERIGKRINSALDTEQHP